MKKIFFSFFLMAAGFANYVGNPVAPSYSNKVSLPKEKSQKVSDFWLKGRLEYEKSYVNNMNLEFTSEGIAQRAQNSAYAGNFLALYANFLKAISLYAKAGEVEPSFNYAVTSLSGASIHELTSVKDFFAWAFGSKFILFQNRQFAAAVEGSYFQTERRSIQVFSATDPSPVQTALSWYSWQVSLGLAYKICPLIPYMGAKYSRTIVTFNPSSFFKMDNRRKFGLFLGCTLLARKYVDLNFEGRLVDENAFSATLAFRF